MRKKMKTLGELIGVDDLIAVADSVIYSIRLFHM